jgi:urease accessory protein
VRTVVEVVARAGPGGRTVLPVVRAAGALAARVTGAGVVHLVGTAAGPLGGDTVTLRVDVGAGAGLVLRSVAASVVLPDRSGRPSETVTELDVAGDLDLGLSPTVVTARASHVATIRARLVAGATLRLTEQVVLGRAGEGPGRWTGTVRVERDGLPLLHATQGLGPGAPGWAAPFTPRAYAGELVLDGGTSGPAVAPDAVLLPLPGGRTATAWAADLDPALSALHALVPTAGGRPGSRMGA